MSFNGLFHELIEILSVRSRHVYTAGKIAQMSNLGSIYPLNVKRNKSHYFDNVITWIVHFMLHNILRPVDFGGIQHCPKRKTVRVIVNNYDLKLIPFHLTLYERVFKNGFSVHMLHKWTMDINLPNSIQIWNTKMTCTMTIITIMQFILLYICRLYATAYNLVVWYKSQLWRRIRQKCDWDSQRNRHARS